MKKLIVILLGISMLTSCQLFTRKFGGNTTITLEKGEKLVEATWKDGGDLWYLVEPMDSDYTPKVKVFKESSVYGVLEGSVTFVENR